MCLSREEKPGRACLLMLWMLGSCGGLDLGVLRDVEVASVGPDSSHMADDGRDESEVLSAHLLTSAARHPPAAPAR